MLLLLTASEQHSQERAQEQLMIMCDRMTVR